MKNDFIRTLITFLNFEKPSVYLEMGIGDGGCFNTCANLFSTAYAVDINVDCLENIKHNSNLRWYCCSTDNFISGLTNEKFNFVFIDAWHSHEQVLKDFIGVFPYVVDNGFILLHDTYPPDEIQLKPEYCNDAYKAAWEIRRDYTLSCEICTLPQESGISIIRKSSRQLLWIKDG